jgi:Ca2+-binding EF-hand superfamily protein
MKRLTILLAGTALVVALGAHALAQSAGDPKSRATAPRSHFLERMDADKNGKVDRAEFAAYRAGAFKDADKDGDGAIDKAEFAAHGDLRRAEGIERFFARHDKNRDGRLTADELPRREGRAALRFDAIDTGKKGAVGADDYARAAGERFEARLKQRFEALDADRDGKLAADELTGRRGVFLAEADRDKDGVVAFDEFAAAPRARFAAAIAAEFKAMDANGDGKLTRAEHAAASKQPRLLLLGDANRDGALTKDEVAAAFAARAGTAFRERGFARIDADKDGKIGAAEWSAAGDRLFGWLDRNGDGAIEGTEIGRRGEPRDGRSRRDR